MAEIEIEAAEWLLSSGDRVWVLSDPEFGDDPSLFNVQGIDTSTNSIVATVPRPVAPCNGHGVSGGSVWVCSGELTYRWSGSTLPRPQSPSLSPPNGDLLLGA